MSPKRETRFFGLSENIRRSDVFDDLDQRYREPHRRYHNWDHIDRLIKLFDAHLDECFDRPATELAIWFHDAIYLPGNPNNEAESERLLRAQTHRMMIDPVRVESAAMLIDATLPGSNKLEDHPHPDAPLIKDLDLSILGSDSATYDDYAKAIAVEYSKLPPRMFASGRVRILEQFVEKAQIFSTELFVAAFEERARANLSREIVTLKTRFA